jgi:hypothetical protein
VVDDLKADLASLEDRQRERHNEYNIPPPRDHANSSLKSLSSTFQQRLKTLAASRDFQEQDTATVAEWLELRGGKNRFKSTIHLPPALTVGVTDPKYANLAESCFQRSELMVPSSSGLG